MCVSSTGTVSGFHDCAGLQTARTADEHVAVLSSTPVSVVKPVGRRVFKSAPATYQIPDGGFPLGVWGRGDSLHCFLTETVGLRPYFLASGVLRGGLTSESIIRLRRLTRDRLALFRRLCETIIALIGNWSICPRITIVFTHQTFSLIFLSGHELFLLGGGGGGGWYFSEKFVFFSCVSKKCTLWKHLKSNDDFFGGLEGYPPPPSISPGRLPGLAPLRFNHEMTKRLKGIPGFFGSSPRSPGEPSEPIKKSSLLKRSVAHFQWSTIIPTIQSYTGFLLTKNSKIKE